SPERWWNGRTQKEYLRKKSEAKVIDSWPGTYLSDCGVVTCGEISNGLQQTTDLHGQSGRGSLELLQLLNGLFSI
ncbi:MAG: hypothetical protein KDB01_05465, partial [Planctomycetaceae bacterium]|nr:hypothetical protein [Planctomycetaceae bacterium]